MIGVGPGLVGRATLDGDVVGEVERPGSQRDRDDRRGQRGGELVERGRRRPDDRRPHLRDQRGRGGDVETPALVVDRRRRDAGFDQLDPPAVHDLVVGRRRHRDGPAEMVRDAQAHLRTFSRVREPTSAVPSEPPRGGRRASLRRHHIRLTGSEEEDVDGQRDDETFKLGDLLSS